MDTNGSTVTSVVDGVHNWFGTNGNAAYTKTTVTGASGAFTTSIINPGFWQSPTGQFNDRAGGNTFYNGLQNTVYSSNLVLIEGLTDVEENAGMYRGETAMGTPAVNPPGGQMWNNGNQYSNIVRLFTQPGTQFTVFEAEACDSFYSPSAPGGGLFRTDGNLNISYTDGTQSQWAVTLNGGGMAAIQFIHFGRIKQL